MKSQERRDEETVTIFAGLLMFLLITATGAVVLVIVHQFVELKAHLINVVVYGLLGAAAVASLHASSTGTMAVEKVRNCRGW